MLDAKRHHLPLSASLPWHLHSNQILPIKIYPLYFRDEPSRMVVRLQPWGPRTSFTFVSTVLSPSSLLVATTSSFVSSFTSVSKLPSPENPLASLPFATAVDLRCDLLCLDPPRLTLTLIPFSWNLLEPQRSFDVFWKAETLIAILKSIYSVLEQATGASKQV